MLQVKFENYVWPPSSAYQAHSTQITLKVSTYNLVVTCVWVCQKLSNCGAFGKFLMTQRATETINLLQTLFEEEVELYRNQAGRKVRKMTTLLSNNEKALTFEPSFSPSEYSDPCMLLYIASAYLYNSIPN